jgi:hypothetical protein
MADSLFAHLALAFGKQPENLATEALGYILRSSSSAREAVGSFLCQLGTTIPRDLTWATQVGGDDNGRPDLVGYDDTGEQPVIVEAKFWAGLTKNQPVAYLNRLPSAGLLVVVAPAKRLTILWNELRRLIVGEGRPFSQTPVTATEAQVASIGDRTMVLVS